MPLILIALGVPPNGPLARTAKLQIPGMHEPRDSGRISVLCKEKFGGHSPAKGSGGQDAHAPLLAQNGDAPGIQDLKKPIW